MIEKKSFTLFDPKPEEDYLNEMAKAGQILEKVDDEGYHFVSGPQEDAYYLVEFYEDSETVNMDLYHNQGFELVSQYFTKRGVWMYFRGENVEEPIQRHVADRDHLLEKAFRRVEFFGMSISGSLVILAVFLILRYKNPVYYLLLGVGLAFFIYVTSVYLNLRRMRKPQ